MKHFFILVIIATFTFLPAEAQLRRAERALNNQEYEEALEYVEEVLADDAEDARAYEVRGRIFQAMAVGKEKEEYLLLLTQMKESFDAAVSLDPKRAGNINGMLAIAYVEEFRMAIDYFNRASQSDSSEHFLSSAQYFEGASIMGPDSSQAYFNWFLALLRADQELEAIRPLEMAVACCPPDSIVYDYLSRMYISNDRTEEAVVLLEEAIEYFPDHQGLQATLLSAYAGIGDSDRALSAYAEKVESEPNNAVYRYNYGTFLLQAEQYEEAMMQFNSAIQLNPEYIDAYYNLGAAYINMAVTVNEAINALDDSLRANRNSLSEEERSAMDMQIDALVQDRRALYDQAITPLEMAKSLSEAEGEDRDLSGMCRALYQAYAQTNQMEKIETVQECAGL